MFFINFVLTMLNLTLSDKKVYNIITTQELKIYFYEKSKDFH